MTTLNLNEMGHAKMQTFILSLQICVPAALVLWVAVFPGPSWLALMAQSLGIGLAFVAMSRVMLWGVPPRWLLTALAAAGALAVASALIGALRKGLPLLPSGWAGAQREGAGLVFPAGIPHYRCVIAPWARHVPRRAWG